jgi:hypothetical protein
MSRQTAVADTDPAPGVCEPTRLPPLGRSEGSPPGEAGLNHWWIAVLTLIVIGTGMAYTLWWPTAFGHHWYWIVPPDIWGSVRAAHWIGWGDFSYVYSAGTGLVTLPGFEVVLTPVVLLGSVIGLGEGPVAFPIAGRYTDWLLVGPFALACSALGLYGLDALARATRIPQRRRRVLLVLEAAVMWPVIAYWGHPEDVLALGLFALGMGRALQARRVSAAWLVGAAIAMQLYVLAAVPILAGLVGLRRALPLIARVSVIPGTLLLAVLIPDPRDTLDALNRGSNNVAGHGTPWVLLVHDHVSAGSVRMVGLATASALGLLAVRRRSDPLAIIWLAGVALGVRCLFEPVVDPYYVAPAIGFALVGVASCRRAYPVVGVAAGLALTMVTYVRLDVWSYWLLMVGAMAVVFAAARSWRTGRLCTMARSSGLPMRGDTVTATTLEL